MRVSAKNLGWLKCIVVLWCVLMDHCKEIEENNRVEKTRDLYRKVRDTKGIFHAKMGSIKDKNGMNPFV